MASSSSTISSTGRQLPLIAQEGPASIFKILRPYCVALNSSLVAFNTSPIAAKDVLAKLETLLQALTSVTRTGNALDTRLADYVFFPVSQIFRERARLPVKAVETALRCLEVLLQSGWRIIKDREVALQLLILLTYCADPSGTRDGPERPKASDDSRDAALSCMRHLFRSVASSKTCKESLLDTPNIPALGHCITVMLDCLKDDHKPGLQRSASSALQHFISSVATPEVIKSFLPGIVSALSHILTPSSGARRPYRLIQTCLQILQKILRSTLADVGPFSGKYENADSTTVDPWRKATAAQMKVVLANIVRLRDHDRDEVKEELKALCWVVVDECRSSLSESSAMMFETLVDLSGTHGSEPSFQALEAYFCEDAAIADTAQSSLYDWVLSLPRIMQSNDDTQRKRTIHKIVVTHRLLIDAIKDMSMIDDLLTSTLVECLTNGTLASNEGSQLGQIQSGSLVEITSRLNLQQEEQDVPDLRVILAHSHKTEELAKELHDIVKHISGTTGACPMAARLLNAARSADQDTQASYLWLCVSILQPLVEESQDLSRFLDFEPAQSEETIFQDLYDFSLSLLASSDETVEENWRVLAIALEGIALQAGRMQQAFRPELVDALYPVVNLMGSKSEGLRSRAVACLNAIAFRCGYESAQELLVQNVDYLVNAVGLKLNAFDISPQAPQVLLMMVRLCGPVLLPYLEDLVGNIFEALDCFHGYPKLVGLLFSVLDGMVDEGVKNADRRVTTGSDSVRHKKVKARPADVGSALEGMERRRKRHMASLEDETLIVDSLPVDTPYRPWSELRSPEANARVDVSENEQQTSDELSSIVKSKEPESDAVVNAPTKTHLMIHSIASLTQHHLPSSSPDIRASVLSLLKRAMPYLSSHDDTFLPLINTLWPVLLPRLLDHEAFVVSGVLDVMACMCEGAGDFMATRIESVWPTIRRIWKSLSIPTKRSGTTTQSRDLDLGSRAVVTASRHGTHELFNVGSAPQQDSMLLDAPDRTSTSLIVTSSTKPSNGTPGPLTPSHGAYIATTTLAIRAALTRFLVAVLMHVRISEEMFSDMLNEMLHTQLVQEKSKAVRGALEIVNEDAVWLTLERTKDAESGGNRMDIWRRCRPKRRGVQP